MNQNLEQLKKGDTDFILIIPCAIIIGILSMIVIGILKSEPKNPPEKEAENLITLEELLEEGTPISIPLKELQCHDGYTVDNYIFKGVQVIKCNNKLLK